MELQNFGNLLDCCYRSGHILVLDSNLSVWKFTQDLDEGDRPLRLEHLQISRKNDQREIKLHNMRFSSCALTTYDSVQTIETGRRFKNPLEGILLETGSNLIVNLSCKAD